MSVKKINNHLQLVSHYISLFSLILVCDYNDSSRRAYVNNKKKVLYEKKFT